MIESIALRIALAIKKIEPNQTASVEVMKFSLEGVLQTFLTVIFLTIVGLITDKLAITLLGALAFAFLRFFSGGMHLKNAFHCSIFSTVLIASAPLIKLNSQYFFMLMIITIIIILIFAPSNIEGHARIPKRYFPFLKAISVLIVCLNFLFLNSTIALVYFFQAVSTIRFKKGVI